MMKIQFGPLNLQKLQFSPQTLENYKLVPGAYFEILNITKYELWAEYLKDLEKFQNSP